MGTCSDLLTRSCPPAAPSARVLGLLRFCAHAEDSDLDAYSKGTLRATKGVATVETRLGNDIADGAAAQAQTRQIQPDEFVTRAELRRKTAGEWQLLQIRIGIAVSQTVALARFAAGGRKGPVTPAELGAVPVDVAGALEYPLPRGLPGLAHPTSAPLFPARWGRWCCSRPGVEAPCSRGATAA